MNSDFSPEVKLSIEEETGNVRAAYIRVRKGKVAETQEVVDGRAFADFNDEGLLLGVELLAPCTVQVLDDISAKDSEPVKRFLRGSPPHALICN